MTKPLSDLEATVERVRAKHFPSLPADLVATILRIESESVENRADAARRVAAALQAHLDQSGA